MKRIITDIDRFFDLVSERKVVTVKEVADTLSVEEEHVERWTKSLEEAGMVSFHYPLVGNKSGAKIKLVENPALAARAYV